MSDKDARVAGAEVAVPNQILDGLRQLQQAQGVGEVAATLADDFGKILLRVTVALHQRVITLTFFDGIEVLALNVLDDGDLDRLLVGQRPNDDRHLVQVRALGGAPAALAGNDLVAVATFERPHDERLHQPTLAD